MGDDEGLSCSERRMERRGMSAKDILKGKPSKQYNGRLSRGELMNSFAFDLKQMFKPGDQKSWVQVLAVIQELSISCWTAHGQCQHLLNKNLILIIF